MSATSKADLPGFRPVLVQRFQRINHLSPNGIGELWQEHQHHVV